MLRLSEPPDEEEAAEHDVRLVDSPTSSSSSQESVVEVRKPPTVIARILRRFRVGRLVGERQIATLEEVDLGDRRGLIPMAELYKSSPSRDGIAGPGASHLQREEEIPMADVRRWSFARRTIGAARDLTRRFRDSVAVAQSRDNEPMASAGSDEASFRSADELGGDYRRVTLDDQIGDKEDPHLQNGRMSSRVEAGDSHSVPMNRKEPKNDKESVTVSRSQVLAALILSLIAVIVAIFLTFTLTKQAIGVPSNESKCEKSIYDDRFDTPATALPHSLPTTPEASVNQTDSGPTAEELRLSNDLMPLWYNLSVKVYVPGFVEIPPAKNLSFDAALIIKFKVRKPTDRIELNAINLKFTEKLSAFQLLHDDPRPKRAATNQTANGEALIVDRNGTRPVPSEIPVDGINADDRAPGAPRRVDSGIRVTKIAIQETFEKVLFHLDANLKQDAEYYFTIPYSGPIDSKLSGLYLTTYTDGMGRKRYAAVSQMEPTDARRFAPSFDEPAMKAVWRLRVIHPRGSRAVSNALEIRENEPTNDSNWLMTTFEETLPMSSYLLALVVSDFEFVEGHTKHNVRFRIWARPEALNETEYALNAGIKCLEFYEDYFGIPFPLAKQDMMAFPDFAAGAMENWGLVTYREKYLLYSPKLYTGRQKMHVATVVAHELAHQWFGNLVTMKWWSDLWLNEGFATLMEYVGASAISDDKFRMEEGFLIDALANALDRDARATSHPLFFEISKAEDVSEAFDSITYDKGGSVLRMIRSIMGEENFKKGVTIYLNRYKFNNAEHKDLWNALSEAVPDSLKDWNGEKFDVNEFAKLWTRQMGYPVIEVQRLDDHRVELTQKRFKLDDSALEKPKFRNAKYWYKWDVPIWYSVDGVEKEMRWLHENTIIDAKEDQSLVVNTDSNGLYRVQYSKKTLAKINAVLLSDHTAISTKSRARIIDDAFTLAQAGRIPYEAALNLTLYLNKETEYLPWFMALSGLDTIQYYFGDEPEVDNVRDYVKSMISTLYSKISFDSLNSSYLDDNRFVENLLEVTIVGKMCINRHLDCTEKVNAIYQKNLVDACKGNKQQSSQCSTVPVPLRGLVYCEGVRSGSEKDWLRMLDLYERESVQVERDRLMAALTCSRDTHTLKKLLGITIDFNNTLIRLQDKASVFESISSQEPVGQLITTEFFMDHWTQIHKDFKDDYQLLRGIITGSIGGTSARTIEQIEKFLSENKATTRNFDVFKQRLEVLYTNRKWMEKNYRPLSDWFQEQIKKRKTTVMA